MRSSRESADAGAMVEDGWAPGLNMCRREPSSRTWQELPSAWAGGFQSLSCERTPTHRGGLNGTIRPDNPTEVGEEVGLSRNGVNRPTDKPGPQNRTRGQSRICPLHCGIEHAAVDASPRGCSVPNQLNPALNGKRADPNGDRPLTMVAGARYTQRCPVEFGVAMEVMIAA